MLRFRTSPDLHDELVPIDRIHRHGEPHDEADGEELDRLTDRVAEGFPAAVLQQCDIEAKSPDDFVLDQVGIDGLTVTACVQQIADSRTRPPQDTEDVLSQLERDGLVESIAALRAG